MFLNLPQNLTKSVAWRTPGGGGGGGGGKKKKKKKKKGGGGGGGGGINTLKVVYIWCKFKYNCVIFYISPVPTILSNILILNIPLNQNQFIRGFSENLWSGPKC